MNGMIEIENRQTEKRINFTKSLIMKTITESKPTTKRKINWALPDQTVTHDEFMDAIKQAEKGPFYSFEEAQIQLQKWKKERGL
jgi:hypothetical protein